MLMKRKGKKRWGGGGGQGQTIWNGEAHGRGCENERESDDNIDGR